MIALVLVGGLGPLPEMTFQGHHYQMTASKPLKLFNLFKHYSLQECFSNIHLNIISNKLVFWLLFLNKIKKKKKNEQNSI